MERYTLATRKTNFDLFFEILSRISNRPKHELILDYGDMLVQEARNPDTLFDDLPIDQCKRYLAAGKLEQAAIIDHMLKDTRKENHFPSTTPTNENRVDNYYSKQTSKSSKKRIQNQATAPLN